MTTTTLPDRPRPRARRTALVAAGSTAAALVLTAAPALAHDQLVSTTPASGSTVEAAPSTVSLAFSNDLITGQGIQNLVTVTDEDGNQWQDGDARVTGPELSAALCEGLPNGEFRVAYRVVYSDGHSEAQQYAFTVDDPGAPDAAAPQDCGVPDPDAPVSDTGDATSTTPAPSGGAGAAAPGSTGGGGEPATAGSGASGTAGDPATGEPPVVEPPAPDLSDASDAAAAAESGAPGVPGWVWAVGAAGVLVVAAGVLSVLRRVRALDRPDRGHGTEG
ncbi:copper resistance protein CopC [Citricoccus sp. SGAir0253]|uniref:copper resistance CopC family protein n=1 Tax=Citricoccus sp. SGAir0253 TaxID=2567881 RepID=UPI0010CD6876|nr:copper resistance CopC family protein [Citricoccus sp. SGAir0253]QCU77249.1 copper resistance protein CopC [Citricoccus sp. SGAir0253]